MAKREKHNKEATKKIEEILEPVENFDPKKEFDEIYNKNSQAVYKYLYLFLKNNEVAEDIFQEVFIKAYDQIIKNKGTRKIPKTWLLTVAKNAALDWIKMNVSRREFLKDPNVLLEVEDLSVSFVQQLEYKEIEEKINEILEILSPKEKTVFILRNTEEMKYKDIASILKISERNAKRIMKSSLRKIVYFFNRMGLEKPEKLG